jgi:hypothetical protein
MTPTPLTAVNRITFKYTVALHPHKQHVYLAVTPSLDPSGFDTVPRSGHAAVGVSTLEAQWANKIKPMYGSTGMTFDGWELEVFLSGHWVSLTSGVSAAVATGGGANVPSSGLIIVTRSGTLAPVRFSHAYYDGGWSFPTKFTSPSGLGTDTVALMNYWGNVSGTAGDTDAWAWAMSKNSIYTQTFISLVTDTNEKLRRRYGLK